MQRAAGSILRLLLMLLLLTTLTSLAARCGLARASRPRHHPGPALGTYRLLLALDGDCATQDPAASLVAAGGSTSNMAKVFDRTRGNRIVGTIAGLSRGVFSLDWAGMEHLAVAGGDCAVRVFDVSGPAGTDTPAVGSGGGKAAGSTSVGGAGGGGESKDSASESKAAGESEGKGSEGKE